MDPPPQDNILNSMYQLWVSGGVPHARTSPPPPSRPSCERPAGRAQVLAGPRCLRSPPPPVRPRATGVGRRAGARRCWVRWTTPPASPTRADTWWSSPWNRRWPRCCWPAPRWAAPTRRARAAGAGDASCWLLPAVVVVARRGGSTPAARVVRRGEGGGKLWGVGWMLPPAHIPFSHASARPRRREHRCSPSSAC